MLPPLRERIEDIPVLVDHFLDVAARRYERAPIEVSSEVRGLLLKYSWPGNVRELAAWTERLYCTGLDPKLLVDSLLAESGEAPVPVVVAQGAPVASEAMTLKQAERQAIVYALEQSNFNQRQAARLLQVHRATLARKLKEHHLD